MSHIKHMKKVHGLEVAAPVFAGYSDKKKLALAFATQMVTSGIAKLTEDPSTCYLRANLGNQQWTFKLDKKTGNVEFSES